MSVKIKALTAVAVAAAVTAPGAQKARAQAWQDCVKSQATGQMTCRSHSGSGQQTYTIRRGGGGGGGYSGPSGAEQFLSGLQGVFGAMQGYFEAEMQRLYNEAVANFNAANQNLANGHYDAAIQQYSVAANILTGEFADAGVFNNRGNAYFRKGDYASARADYHRALQLGSPNAQSNLANLEHAIEDKRRRDEWNRRQKELEHMQRDVRGAQWRAENQATLEQNRQDIARLSTEEAALQRKLAALEAQKKRDISGASPRASADDLGLGGYLKDEQPAAAFGKLKGKPVKFSSDADCKKLGGKVVRSEQVDTKTGQTVTTTLCADVHSGRDLEADRLEAKQAAKESLGPYWDPKTQTSSRPKGPNCQGIADPERLAQCYRQTAKAYSAGADVCGRRARAMGSAAPGTDAGIVGGTGDDKFRYTQRRAFEDCQRVHTVVANYSTCVATFLENGGHWGDSQKYCDSATGAGQVISSIRPNPPAKEPEKSKQWYDHSKTLVKPNPGKGARSPR